MSTTLRPRHVQFARLFSLVLLIACGPRSAPPEGEAARVARGQYLVEFGQCHDCHSPKVFTADGPIPDSTRLLSGHPADAKLPAIPIGVLGPDRWGFLGSPDLTAFVGPWGVSFTANLTPDPTGLGSWTVEQFIQTMRTGKHLGVGRPILPPMPWHYVGKLTDEDLRAVFAYLRTLKPVSNAVPAPVPPEQEAAPR
jgi:mono/diheme cytochrome c family protein